MRKIYEGSVVGMPYEGRAEYVLSQVAAGDRIELRDEPTNPHDAGAIAVFHLERKIGYLRARDQWLRRYMRRANYCSISVEKLYFDEDDELAAVDLYIDLDLPDPPSPPPSIMSEVGDELRLLMTVAVADGRLQRTEREVLERFAEIRAAEVGVKPDKGEAARAISWARKKAPSDAETPQLIGRLAINRPSAFDAILEVAEIVAELDGKVVEVEKARIESLRKLIAVARSIT